LEDIMRNPRLKKLLEYRKGTSQARRERAKWRRWEADGLMPHLARAPMPILEPEVEPISEESFADITEPYSFYREDDQVLEVTRHDGAVCCQLFTV
jgi:hypothetical protein